MRQILERLSVPQSRGRYFLKNSFFESKINPNFDVPLWEVFSDVTNMRRLKTQNVQVNLIYDNFVIKLEGSRIFFEGTCLRRFKQPISIDDFLRDKQR